ncbi:hypothetical protein [Streptomyces kronopolitis]|uniref:hypothetical protein n=1 Tax=Streptomyces kronopolitis TaxID=1612435 RepID=UPI003D96E5C5
MTSRPVLGFSNGGFSTPEGLTPDQTITIRPGETITTTTDTTEHHYANTDTDDRD